MQLLYLCCVFVALVAPNCVSAYPKRRQLYRYQVVPSYPQYIRGYRSAYTESKYPAVRGYYSRQPGVQPRQTLPVDCNHCAEDPATTVPQFESEPFVPTVNEEPSVPEVEIEPAKSPELPKKVPKPPQAEDSDDEAEPSFGNVPIYNTFFPMNFARGFAAPNGRSQEGEGPGGAMAIANSYSTGKGGVATSHATAYGSGSP